MLEYAGRDRIALRFKVGDRVVCGGTDEDGRIGFPGTVVALFYRQPSFPPGKCAAYQVRQDRGTLVYANLDTDEYLWAEPPSEAAAAAAAAAAQRHTRRTLLRAAGGSATVW